MVGKKDFTYPSLTPSRESIQYINFGLVWRSMLRLLFAGSKFRGECHPLHAGSYDEYGPQLNPKFTWWAALVGCNFPLRQHGPSPPPQLHCHSKKGIAWASITVAPEPNSGDLNTSTGSEKTCADQRSDPSDFGPT